MTLQDELHRIADRAPVVAVPDDTWTRGRRSLHRGRALTAAAAVAVVAVVAGLVAWQPTHDRPPVADGAGLGVPDQVYAVPERMAARDNDDHWIRDEVTDDPTAVGTGAVAWVTHDGLPVVVGAADGVYHLLDLPDFVGNNWYAAVGLGEPAVALSPDGHELAYSYAVFGPDAATEPIPSGIRVVDLDTGSVREIPVPRKEGTAVHQIEWSPDGRWLAFAGVPQDTWTTGTMGSHGPAVLGRIAPGADRAELRDLTNSQAPLAIDDRGTVQWRTGRVHVWGTGSRHPSALDSLGRLPDGRWLERTGTANNDVLSVQDSDHRRHILVDIYGIDGSLTVATDLMLPGHLTVHRPEPDWPPSDEQRFATIAISAGVGLVLLFLALTFIRRFRSRES